MKIEQVKPAIANKTHAHFNGIVYYITAVVMRFKGGEWIYTVELHDIKANSVTIAAIEKVELKGS